MWWVRLIAVILCLTPGTALAAEEVSFGRYHALVIGNNAYSDMPELRTAAGDAKAVAKILTAEYGFKSQLLINASRTDIIDALAALRARLKVNDNLLIYFAGHGVLDSYANEGYWLPIDAKKGSPANWISNDDVTNMVRALRARHVMVVADSCFSGTLVRAAPSQIKTAAGRQAWLRRMVKRRSRTALVSGGLEPVLDAGGGDHSVFAKAFLEALRENQDVLEGQALFARLKRPVALEADQTPQYSDIRRAGHDGGEFLFVRRASAPAPAAAARPKATKPAFDARAMDLAFWSAIKDSENASAFEAYLQQFPKGTFVVLAQLKLAALRASAGEEQAKAAAQAEAAAAAQAKSRRRAEAAARVRANAEAEDALWHSVVASDTVASYRTYLATYPGGRHAAQARHKASAASQREAQAKARAAAALEAEQRRASEAQVQAAAAADAKLKAERGRKEAEARAIAAEEERRRLEARAQAQNQRIAEAEEARRQATAAAAAAKERAKAQRAQQLAALTPAKPGAAPKTRAAPLVQLKPSDLLGVWSDTCGSKYGRRLIIGPDKVGFQDGQTDVDEWLVYGMPIEGAAQATIKAGENSIELVRNSDGTLSVLRHSQLDDKGTCTGRNHLVHCRDNQLFYRKFLWITLRLARCQPAAPQDVARLSGYLKQGWPRRERRRLPLFTGAEDAGR